MYIFDLDGTLLESNQVWEEIDEIFLNQRGIGSVPADYTDYVTHHGFYEAAEYTKARYSLQESPEEIVAIWQQMGRRAYGETLPLKEGAKELLQQLQGRGEKMALLTSCMRELCQLALERHGLTNYFTHVFTSAELGMEKRTIAIYGHVASLCGVAPEDCIFFDDAPTYCEAARKSGMQVVGVWDPLFASREGEMRVTCHRYLKSLAEFE